MPCRLAPTSLIHGVRRLRACVVSSSEKFAWEPKQPHRVSFNTHDFSPVSFDVPPWICYTKSPSGVAYLCAPAGLSPGHPCAWWSCTSEGCRLVAQLCGRSDRTDMRSGWLMSVAPTRVNQSCPLCCAVLSQLTAGHVRAA